MHNAINGIALLNTMDLACSTVKTKEKYHGSEIGMEEELLK